jgi:hypothetical protein
MLSFEHRTIRPPDTSSVSTRPGERLIELRRVVLESQLLIDYAPPEHRMSKKNLRSNL